ncbi:GyrI-like domain-containing protein [Chitiniphilus purpureus]|uniref:GyrI-like domain-containing protein n=1 Tax=Chitiniphilus purpureus TaxID=2981137 RepID=A0ABY6DIK5_9NEIS|nr:GyrI-like domain-containing protein [Chitiniphilus sp. CD1]UXY14180.1 GyrI-like domain-containing protein [Chitiniphilus sp. CD1]
MNVRVERHPGATVMGYKISTTLRCGLNQLELPPAWARINAGGLLTGIPGRVQARCRFGVVYDFNPQTTDFNYLIGVAVAPTTPVPVPLAAVRLPPSHYAVLTTEPAQDEQGFVQAIEQGWGDLTQHWLPASGYRHACSAEFEKYDECLLQDPEARRMEIWVPICGQGL